MPKADVCNGVDDNCDGRADEYFDLQNDPRWCGACDRPCVLPDAVSGCRAGQCVVKSCRAGFVDLDRRADNGCEYPCTPDGPEVCDGKDNDCDGQTDGDDSDLLYPAMNFCTQAGECGKGPGGSPRFPQPTYPVCSKPAGADRRAGSSVATASLAACVTPDLDTTQSGAQAAFDMSGNLAEWTDDCRGFLTDGSGRKIYTLRGGSFNNMASALRCDFTALVVAETFSFDDTGFRCCSSCAPGLADCGPGLCVKLGTDAAHCGGCGKACPQGQSCQNGVCR